MTARMCHCLLNSLNYHPEQVLKELIREYVLARLTFSDTGFANIELC